MIAAVECYAIETERICEKNTLLANCVHLVRRFDFDTGDGSAVTLLNRRWFICYQIEGILQASLYQKLFSQVQVEIREFR